MISAGGAAGVGYYSSGGGGDEARDASGRNYYTGATDHGERPGQWSGKLADALGLTGTVDARIMEDVYERFTAPDGHPIGSAPRSYLSMEERVAAALAREPSALPERVEEIRREVERGGQSTCRGMDLTFSVPKSVTVAYVAAWRAEQEAIRDGHPDRADGFASIREAIDGAILDANQAALDYVADLTQTRVGRHGHGYAGQWVPAPGLVVASFPQLTSRADDPQYHVHNVILNRARTDDGRIGALDTVDLRQQRHAYSAVADRMLSERLGDAGIRVAMRPDGMAREIVGIDQEALDSFSQRRAQITRAMAPRVREQEERLGRELNALERSRLAQTINLATREAKGKGEIDWDAMLDRWQDQITDDIGAGLLPIAEQLRAMVEDGAPIGGQTFSPDAVIAQAIQAAAEQRASWSRADLLLEIDRALPDQLGLPAPDMVELLERLTDAALAVDGVVQVSGNTGALPPPDLIPGSFTRPSDAHYAAPVTMEAENLILRAAVERGGHAVDRAAVEEWLTERYPGIGPDQRAAVVGLASSDAAVAQLVGPAGTGKSYTAGALAGAWEELSGGGQVIGLAVSQVAAEVLRADGVETALNTAAWRASQGRLAGGTVRGDEIQLGPKDLVLVDETSMIGTMDLDQIRQDAQDAGARVVLMGDPRQLGAVGAGGAMGLLDGQAETYALANPLRFSEEWERGASLGLREGSVDALEVYDVHGRLIETPTMDDALTAAARAAAAERLGGRSVSVTADTNADAWRVADQVREHLVAAGVVEEDGIILGRTGGVAGIGDQVMTRQIDYGLGVLNGDRWSVVGTGDDGSLSVLGDDGQVRELPAAYVQAATEQGTPYVQLAYASTVHGSQGKTVDVGYTVTGGQTSASALYVGMSRGREGNWAFVAMQPGHGQDRAPYVEEPDARPSAVSVLGDALARETESTAALTQQRADAERLANMDTVMGRIEEITHRACRARLDDDLDRLVEERVLSEQDRAALTSDQSTDHLSRVCRAAEQAGHDPSAVLRQAIEDRPLEGSRSVAQVVAARITGAHDVAAAQPGAFVMPDRLPAEHREYLGVLHEQAQDRARELGSRAAQDQPGWAVKALGAVPDDVVARLEWEDRAGAIASYREAKGMEGDRAIPAAPGLSQTEARAAWWGAWEALGRPQETRLEAALSDGALQARVAAWGREQTWAPAHANASLRAAELEAAEARHSAILARAAGDEQDADRWEARAAERAAVASGMSATADARGAWAEQTAVTQDLAERAAAELRERGLEPGQEPDRVPAQEWLEHQREVDARDEAVRDVTELDVPIHDSTIVDNADNAPQDGVTDVSGETLGSAHSPEPSGHGHGEDAATDGALRDAASPLRGEAGAERGGEAPPATAIPEDVPDVTDDGGRTATDSANEIPASDGPDTDAAQRVAPIEPDHAELSAIVAVARAAQDRVADRESEQAAHDAWEADESAPPVDSSEADDEAEAYSASDMLP